jgi:hypothetical protein
VLTGWICNIGALPTAIEVGSGGIMRGNLRDRGSGDGTYLLIVLDHEHPSYRTLLFHFT